MVNADLDWVMAERSRGKAIGNGTSKEVENFTQLTSTHLKVWLELALNFVILLPLLLQHFLLACAITISHSEN